MSGRGSERILDLLEWLAERSNAAGLADSAQALSIPKSSALLLLRILVERGYVRRLPDGRYLLVRLPGERIGGQGTWTTLLRLAEPLLHNAVERSGESVFIAVLEGDRIRYLNKLLPDVEIRYDRDIGPARWVHQVSSGIVLLSCLAEEEAARRLDNLGLAGSERRQVEALIAQARRDGFYFNAEGVVEGAAGIAAPIVDGMGRTVAALNISGPQQRIRSKIADVTGVILDVASGISAELAKRSRSNHQNSSGRSST
ncbi:IclR family transcriptional regulator [Agaricicola taiwanensis]|uniref:IclR family transcriptional regulator n=1 Tax=Agaricicola taiwanensis TaxID=591372 RepID=UPI0016694E97|nr:IclR family transcriptional regulator C-terminal domain-containing protein [Agaricicola taiwanensis]